MCIVDDWKMSSQDCLASITNLMEAPTSTDHELEENADNSGNETTADQASGAATTNNNEEHIDVSACCYILIIL